MVDVIKERYFVSSLRIPMASTTLFSRPKKKQNTKIPTYLIEIVKVSN